MCRVVLKITIDALTGNVDHVDDTAVAIDSLLDDSGMVKAIV